MVAAGRQWASRSTITPTKYALQALQMHQEGWGAHLVEHTARGTWSLSEASYTLNYLELGRCFGPKRVSRHLVEHFCCHSQTTPWWLPVKRGGDEVGPFLCPTMENPDLVLQETGDSSLTHYR